MRRAGRKKLSASDAFAADQRDFFHDCRHLRFVPAAAATAQILRQTARIIANNVKMMEN